ncbi:hypothetical protein D6B99_15880 [Arachidicoccus soli]|uniref:Serine protease n=2 Tax=Arachidicoccus soli TaxID=2341117 RepID=A0A386HU59_9BACT|nr:hypothetical protein D6B99_15880 [Arachidicoccus soli]
MLNEVVKSSIEHNLYELTHKFVYLVSVDIYGKEMSIALVKDGVAHYSAWKPDSNVNVINATAFIVDKQGHCITSDYAVEPWNNEYDQATLKTAFSEQLGVPKEAITVGGMSESIQLKNKETSDTGIIVLRKNISKLGVGWVVLKRFSKDISDSELIKTIPDLSQNSSISILPHAEIYTYSFSSSGEALPVEKSVTVVNNTNHIIQFEATKKALPEGTPFFDPKGNILGIYTNSNKKSLDNISSFSLISIHY